MIEIHAFVAENGHILSTDCWCEPATISVSKTKDGTPCLIVEHDDTTLLHHLDIIRERRGVMGSLDYKNDPNAPWITQIGRASCRERV